MSATVRERHRVVGACGHAIDDVEVTVADLRARAALGSVGLSVPDPDDDWVPFQDVGDELWRRGWTGLAAPAAARRGAATICLFRPPGVIRPPGVTFLPPPARHDRAPTVPRGLRA